MSALEDDELEFRIVSDEELSNDVTIEDVNPALIASAEEFAMPDDLQDYWIHGKGALKIRWGTPGDFTRCVRQLREHIGVNTEGACANLHHKATGTWPGEKK